MSPHAVARESMDGFIVTKDGHNVQTNGDSTASRQPQLLSRDEDSELHDLVCVGFGPASLAIAVALYDALESDRPSPVGLSRPPKVRFLERQQRFTWHAGMMLPGTKMQISFVKDLATLRNPRSRFTFLNYLHEKKRLTAFTNLGTFLPQRMEYEDYMRWCAGHFDEVVDYSHDVQAIERGQSDSKSGAVEFFQVRSWDRKAQTHSLLKARHVVVAIGGEPNIPAALRISHPSVIHSSQYAVKMREAVSTDFQPKSVAVIGGGQSAAEVFHDVSARFPGAKTYLLIKGSALRPSDDSPFVNEIFDPDRVDDIYAQEPTARAKSLAEDKATNYGVVRLELLEQIYSELYSQRIKYDTEDDWPQRLLPHRHVTSITSSDASEGHALRLHMENTSGDFHVSDESRHETLDVDLVVIASGYKRNAHESLMQDLQPLTSNDGRPDRPFGVGRDYRVRFKPDAVCEKAGVWLQGCNEGTHGLSDTLLSILAVRGGEMVQSIFGDS